VSERILVVDDEPAIVDAVAYALRSEGFEVESRGDGESALEAALADGFDLLILDLRLPGLSGIEVCRRLRAASEVPILILSARDSEVDRVLGLEAGADDYVTKPFSLTELVSRVRAIFRRRDLDRGGAQFAVRTVGGLRIDFVRHRVTADGRELDLTPTEFRLLALLAQEPGRVFRRREVMQHLWNSTYVGDERACDVHVSKLRRKIEPEPGQPQRLVTVRGAGYRLDAV
jgi:two-component system, OmpR family, response regulator RegX3